MGEELKELVCGTVNTANLEIAVCDIEVHNNS